MSVHSARRIDPAQEPAGIFEPGGACQPQPGRQGSPCSPASHSGLTLEKLPGSNARWLRLHPRDAEGAEAVHPKHGALTKKMD